MELKYPPYIILTRSNSSRKPILIEIKVKTLEDLRALETGVLQEGDAICFLNFKNINVSPTDIENEIIEISQENRFRYSERILPYCRKSIKAKREESNIRRLILYKSGKTFKSGILDNEVNEHNSNALKDITYNIESVPRDFDPHMIMAKLHTEARNCHLCNHCVRTEDVTWCSIVKNGSTRKGTFKVEKLNPSQLRWAPPVHGATGGHGFSIVPPCSTRNIEILLSGCLFFCMPSTHS